MSLSLAPIKQAKICFARPSVFKSKTYYHPHTHSPRINVWRPCLTILWQHASNHMEYSHMITDRRHSFLYFQGASGFFIMLIHVATQRGNQVWTLNEYPSFINSINHSLRTLVVDCGNYNDLRWSCINIMSCTRDSMMCGYQR